MHKHAWVFALALLIFGLGIPLSQARAAHGAGWSLDSNSIDFDGGDVVIHAKDGSRARLGPKGDLSIAGEPQQVTSAERRQLVRYVATVEDLRARALALAGAAGNFAGSVVSEVLGGLFSGASEAEIDARAHQSAHAFAQKALPICVDARNLKDIQNQLVAALPAFAPYAVIRGHDVDQCQHDIDTAG
ncbi:MAG: hypothetical protein ACRETQ_03750 [Gammaproteobacteria bacterium]